MKSKAITIDFIKLVAKGLGDLNEKAVYVGGAAVPFYLPSEMQAAFRPTEDIDVVLEVIQTRNRAELEEELRQRGFKHDQTEGAPLCRWKFRDLTVDIMAANEQVFGFTNKWYAEGVAHSYKKDLGAVEIKILTLPYFLATKLEAFKGRGAGDFLASPDMEDIITILDGLKKDTFKSVLRNLGAEISTYLKDELANLLKSSEFRSAIPGAVSDRLNVEVRTANILATTQRIVEFLGGKREFDIVINGELKEWPHHEITYEDLVHLAYPPPPPGIIISYTIEYERGDEKKPEGSMRKGQKVKIKDGIIFSVTETGRS